MKPGRQILLYDASYGCIEKLIKETGDWSTLNEEAEANPEEQSYLKGEGQIRRIQKERNQYKQGEYD